MNTNPELELFILHVSDLERGNTLQNAKISIWYKSVDFSFFFLFLPVYLEIDSRVYINSVRERCCFDEASWRQSKKKEKYALCPLHQSMCQF